MGRMNKSTASNKSYTGSPNEVKIGGAKPSSRATSGASNLGAREGDSKSSSMSSGTNATRGKGKGASGY